MSRLGLSWGFLTLSLLRRLLHSELSVLISQIILVDIYFY